MPQSTLSFAATHEVFNQPPPLADYNLFTSDRVLKEAVARDGAGWAASDLTELGATLGRRETIERGFAANTNPPAMNVTAAMKSAISDGVSVQSLRMLRLASWTVRDSVPSKH